MHCPRCQSLALPDSRFCSACGSELVLRKDASAAPLPPEASSQVAALPLVPPEARAPVAPTEVAEGPARRLPTAPMLEVPGLDPSRAAAPRAVHPTLPMDERSALPAGPRPSSARARPRRGSRGGALVGLTAAGLAAVGGVAWLGTRESPRTSPALPPPPVVPGPHSVPVVGTAQQPARPEPTRAAAPPAAAPSRPGPAPTPAPRSAPAGEPGSRLPPATPLPTPGPIPTLPLPPTALPGGASACDRCVAELDAAGNYAVVSAAATAMACGDPAARERCQEQIRQRSPALAERAVRSGDCPAALATLAAALNLGVPRERFLAVESACVPTLR